jgi:hypothetical protein
MPNSKQTEILPYRRGALSAMLKVNRRGTVAMRAAAQRRERDD